ncbi:uncharacterized Ntn-hydrolase superfamily protein [Bacillus oleivorans]|uniref:Uncharacterized Ntn-hydrolase superfamily protein n=1 Tax=Bacillus oleivorans TaxID=1448271 RepID=A0A285CZ54_9BACI|nr:DUF1028 domain-containing protein [Bacillus oleivorans]SNX72832.1 uncharacterized Ntn-hydrolase superfamily protein [Bacillus oleivorans]
MTFSIVGYDPKAKEWGVAVQSKFLGVGAVVPWAKAGVGAIATQSYANTTYGPRGLAMLERGMSAAMVIHKLIQDDPDHHLRQIGVVDAQGNAASYTGKGCYDWAGGQSGLHFAAQGNILVDEKTVIAMSKTFTQTKGALAERLMAALEKGQEAGGDKRGMQSASLLVVKEKGGYGGFNDRYIDLRVEDHKEPIQELKRIYQLHQLYFAKPSPEKIVRIEGDVEAKLVTELNRRQYLTNQATSSDELHQALTKYIHSENFEMREQEIGLIDLDVLEYMKKQGV